MQLFEHTVNNSSSLLTKDAKKEEGQENMKTTALKTASISDLGSGREREPLDGIPNIDTFEDCGVHGETVRKMHYLGMSYDSLRRLENEQTREHYFLIASQSQKKFCQQR